MQTDHLDQLRQAANNSETQIERLQQKLIEIEEENANQANAQPEEIEEIPKKASSIKVASTQNVHGNVRDSWRQPLQKVDTELRDYVHELLDKIEEKTDKKIKDMDSQVRTLRTKVGADGIQRKGTIGPGRGRGGMNKTNTSETIEEESPSRGRPAGRGRGGRGGMSRSPPGPSKNNESTS